MNINFRSELESDLPTEAEFNSIPSLKLVAEEDNADALCCQLILVPAIQEEPVQLPPAVPVIPPDPEHVQDFTEDIEIVTDIGPDPYLPEVPKKYNDADIGKRYDEDGNIQ